jgi:hypothetical protein
MKAILALLVTVSAFSAQALESHYGKARKSGNALTCSITNKSEGTLDMKYVVFGVSYLGRHGNDGQVQERIDQRVRSGESYTAKVRESGILTVDYCRFLAR